MLDRFHKYNTENGLFRSEDKLLVAVSGGVDSVVLCHLLKASDLNFAIAHCNFGLRGKESDEDEIFVEELAEELEVNIHLKKFDTRSLVKESGISVQMAARALRYEWFYMLADQKGYSGILTAHHQNDLAETVLLNLVRGTGIAGLHGIKPKSEKLIRPLLFASKEEILDYAKTNTLHWREDSSNESAKYQRNLLRLEVIPLLKQLNPNLEHTLQQSVEKISAAETIFNNYIEGCRLDFLSKKENYSILDYSFLNEESEPKIILFELLKPFGFNYTQANEILESLGKEAGKKFFSVSHFLVKDRGVLIITEKNDNENRAEVKIEATCKNIPLPWSGQYLSVDHGKGYTTKDPLTVAYLDYKKLKFPLIVRPWQAGDSFQPLGMKGRKKISDFLNDLKVPVNLKENISVVLSGNDIVWVVGFRIDEQYKAKEAQEALRLSLE